MHCVGLTGVFGVGKSTAAAFFRKHGALVIDADRITHELQDKDVRLKKEIVAAFGREVLVSDRIDRKMLGKIVFDNPVGLRRLEALMFPRIRRVIVRRLKEARRGLVVIDAALLFEAGWDKLADIIVTVKAPRDVLIARTKARTNLKRADILKRLRRQWPQSKKAGLADFVLDNSGSQEDLNRQVKQLILKIHNHVQEKGKL